MWLITLLAVAIAYSLLSRRIQRLEERSNYEDEVANLLHRVWKLEQAGRRLQGNDRPTAEPKFEKTQEVRTASETVVHDHIPNPPVDSVSSDTSTEVLSAPVASFGDRIRNWISENDWEALVGGNILNKIGALVLVVGIALFCGYSFHRVGPVGRATAALVTSAAILFTGMFLERRATYQTFGRGLIGAGWAALYATTYAIYAVPAARLIEDGFVGSIIQLAIAALMILHSVRYRSQTVTSLAYFAGFLALAVTPSNQFAVLSLIPLSAALLYLAHRFHWHRIALLGLIATYLTCASRGSAGAPIWSIQALFIVYWAVFETFDLLRARRRITGDGLEWIFPLNAIGFIGLSYGAWSSMRSDDLWIMATLTAVLYAVSAFARLIVRPPSSFASTDLLTRLEQGSFEGACALAALMSGMAIVARVPGVWKSLGLALEAELLYLAGVGFQLRFLQHLGIAGFLSSLAGTWLQGAARPGHTLIFGYSVFNWTPSAALHVAAFYLNRFLRKNDTIFSFVGSALLALIIGVESPAGYAGLLLMSLGALLFELGSRKNLEEFRFQGSGIAVLGALGIVWEHGLALSRPAADPVWISLLAGSVIAWGLVIRILLNSDDSVAAESPIVRDVAAGAGSILLLMTAVVLVPGALVTAAWFIIASACLALGLTAGAQSFRWLAQALMLCAFCRFAVIDFVSDRHWYLPAWAIAAIFFQLIGTRRNWIDLRILSHWIALLAVCFGIADALSSGGGGTAKAAILGTIAVFYAAQFLTEVRETLPETWFDQFERFTRVVFSVYGTALLTAFLWGQVSGKILTMAWGLEGLLLLGAGFPLRLRALRLSGLALLLICVCKLFLYDLRNLESLYRTLSFIALGAILLGVSWIYTRFRDRLRQYL